MVQKNHPICAMKQEFLYNLFILPNKPSPRLRGKTAMWHNFLTEFHGHWPAFWGLWILFFVVLWMITKGNDDPPRGDGGTMRRSIELLLVVLLLSGCASVQSDSYDVICGGGFTDKYGITWDWECPRNSPCPQKHCCFRPRYCKGCSGGTEYPNPPPKEAICKKISEMERCTTDCYKHIISDQEVCLRACDHIINGIPYEDME